MSITSGNVALPKVVSTWMVAALLLGVVLMAPGQSAGPLQSKDKTRIANASKNVQEFNYSLSDINVLAEGNATQAIPLLEASFAKASDVTNKGKIASALVRLKDDKPIYWNYLVEIVTPVVDDDIPYQAADGDEAGLSDEFKKWAQEHDLTMEQVAQRQFDYAGRIIFLASAQDDRATYLLRRALSVHDYMIQAFAARGLALLRDKDAVPLIERACATAPADAASAIAVALVYFDDSGAQEAASRYLRAGYLNALREGRAKGQGPLD